MKRHFLIVAATLLMFMNAFPQQLNFKGSPVDTLQIRCNSGYYHFDTCGTSTGTKDRYLIVFAKEKNSYVLHSYNRTDYKRLYKPDTLFEKKTILKKNSLISARLMSALLQEFEANYKKPALENLGLSKEQFLKLTGRKKLVKAARRYGSGRSYFSDRFFNDGKELSKACQQMDTFHVYLAEAFDTTSYTMITDVWKEFDVYISTGRGKYAFSASIPNPFMQPWDSHIYKGEIFTKLVLNFSINTALVALLPKTFAGITSLKPEALMNDYIVWYLRRRGIVY